MDIQWGEDQMGHAGWLGFSKGNLVRSERRSFGSPESGIGDGLLYIGISY